MPLRPFNIMEDKKSRVIAFIFARGGSKGLPGKNVRPLAGKPLIAHSIDIARRCQFVETVIVSTDDEEIAAVARSHGAEVPFMRPSELATDTAPEWLAWRHAIEWVRTQRGDFDIFLSLPATSPFRTVEDVEACVRTLEEDAATDVVVTVRAAERSPYFNMVVLNEDGKAELVIKPTSAVSRRQDAPVLYDITTVAYAARPQFILCAERLFDGIVRTVNVPAERALDIDTPYDFMLAEAIARHRFEA
ncbi:cytidylyltransferase domain-containing protein [Herbaspirillum robiniae]|uniref:acylneuraminate cytidylyltransferase family protein n=1 Tax=Herbaspirillum robiniae TaxID=2014887 RepID=UPI003D772B59